MSWEPKRPGYPLLWLLPPVLFLAVGYGAWSRLSAPRPSPAELAPLLEVAPPLASGAAAAMEKSWIDETFKAEYVGSPPRWQVCTEGIDDLSPEQKRELGTAQRLSDTDRLMDLHKEIGGRWPTGLVLGTILTQQGKTNDANQLLKSMLTSRGPRLGYRDEIDSVLVARTKNLFDEGPPDQHVIFLTYLLHTAGYAKFRYREVDKDFWWTLKNPIACAKLLKARNLKVLVDKVEDGFEWSLQPPGCSASQATDLSSYDLYNNLIAAYLRFDFREKEEKRRTDEFDRSYPDPPGENPLLAVLRAGAVDLAKHPERESWLWAISNAEKILRNRLRETHKYPDNPYLALTLAQLVESAVEASPPEALGALVQQRSGLLQAAMDGKSKIAAGPDRQTFDLALARLLLIEASRTRQAPDLQDVKAALSPEYQRTADLVSLALSRRQDSKSWAERAAGVGDPELQGKLGARYEPWLGACRHDAAVALALYAGGQGVEEQRRLARLATRILRAGDSTPEELERLQASLGWRERLLSLVRSPVGSIVSAFVLALITAVLAYWFCLQLKLRRELFLSFYREETLQRLRRSQ
jgi:hypothetical protein